MKFAFAVLVALFAQAAMACPAAPFTARGNQDDAVARLQGDRILSSGWEVYSTGEDEDYTLTRYRKDGSRYALWLYRAKRYDKQPGILWGVWRDAGMIEGFVNVYEIRTDVRGLGSGEARVTYDAASRRHQVHCR